MNRFVTIPVAALVGLMVLSQVVVVPSSADTQLQETTFPPKKIAILEPYKSPDWREPTNAREMLADDKPFKPEIRGMFESIASKLDKKRVWGTAIQTQGVPRHFKEEDIGPAVLYPPLPEGALVPILGYIYRLQPLLSPQAIEFRLMADNDLPKGVSVRPDSVVVPLKRFDQGGMATLPDVKYSLDIEIRPNKPRARSHPFVRLWVEKIEEPAQGEEGPVARMRLEPDANPNLVNSTAQVKKRDVILIGDAGFMVRNVVPADDATGVIGWVELDWRPIVGEKLTKEDKLVRPAPLLFDLKDFVTGAAKVGAAPMKTIELHHSAFLPGPSAILVDGKVIEQNTKGWFGELSVKPDGKRRAWRVFMSLPSKPKPIGRDVAFTYPPLAEGELVPMLGEIYRVAPFKPGYFIEFHQLPEKEIPLNAGVQPESLVLPLWRLPGYGGFAIYEVTNFADNSKHNKNPHLSPHWEIRVEKIEPSQNAEKGLLAELGIWPRGNPKIPVGTAKIRKGDVLSIGESGHRVRNIVPADDKTGVIGWVELDWRPIVGDELAKEKRLVRPSPKK